VGALLLLLLLVDFLLLGVVDLFLFSGCWCVYLSDLLESLHNLFLNPSFLSSLARLSWSALCWTAEKILQRIWCLIGWKPKFVLRNTEE
jgi:hypothetical protein